MAIRDNVDIDDMQKAIMATFYHVTSRDEEPRHEFCPLGSLSWCKYRAAEAEGKAPPPHTYKLAALHCCQSTKTWLPSVARLLPKQKKKSQHAAESLHSVVWSILPEELNASLIAAETAVNEAVCKYNTGTLHAYREFCASLGPKPGKHSIQRAAEKDAIREKKASKVHQSKHQMLKRPHITKDTKNYDPGAFQITGRKVKLREPFSQKCLFACLPSLRSHFLRNRLAYFDSVSFVMFLRLQCMSWHSFFLTLALCNFTKWLLVHPKSVPDLKVSKRIAMQEYCVAKKIKQECHDTQRAFSYATNIHLAF